MFYTRWTGGCQKELCIAAPQRLRGPLRLLFLRKESEYRGTGAGHDGIERPAAQHHVFEIRDLPGLLCRQDFFKYIPHLPGHSPQVSRSQGLLHGIMVRAAAQFFHPHPPEECRSGQAELRFAHHDRTCRQRRQVCQHLAPALCQCCAAPNTEGHVAAHLKADPLQLLPGHLRRIQRPQRLEHRSAVGAAAGHSRLHGDTLFQQDLRTAVLHAHSVIKGPRCFPGDVSRPAGEILPDPFGR